MFVNGLDPHSVIGLISAFLGAHQHAMIATLMETVPIRQPHLIVTPRITPARSVSMMDNAHQVRRLTATQLVLSHASNALHHPTALALTTGTNYFTMIANI